MSAVCEFCGTAGDTRLMWSDEHGRKVRVCRSLAACFDRVTAPIRALSQTSTGVDAVPADRAASPTAQQASAPTDLATSTPDRAVDVAGTTGPTS